MRGLWFVPQRWGNMSLAGFGHLSNWNWPVTLTQKFLLKLTNTIVLFWYVIVIQWLRASVNLSGAWYETVCVGTVGQSHNVVTCCGSFASSVLLPKNSLVVCSGLGGDAARSRRLWASLRAKMDCKGNVTVAPSCSLSVSQVGEAFARCLGGTYYLLLTSCAR